MRFRKQVSVASTDSWPLMGLVCGLSMILLLPFAGCGPTDAPIASEETAQAEADRVDEHEHEGHEHASASLTESVDELSETFAMISQGFAEDDAESVHDQLHDVGHLLEAIESKVKAGEGIADGKQEMAEQSVAALFENFMTLDDSLHGDDDADTDAALSKIADQLKQLKDVMQ